MCLQDGLLKNYSQPVKVKIYDFRLQVSEHNDNNHYGLLKSEVTIISHDKCISYYYYLHRNHGIIFRLPIAGNEGSELENIYYHKYQILLNFEMLFPFCKRLIKLASSSDS